MKTVLFVFNGDPMCFIHVLLNALDLHGHGHETCIVMEGASRLRSVAQGDSCNVTCTCQGRSALTGEQGKWSGGGARG